VIAIIDGIWGALYATWVASEIAILAVTRARTRAAGAYENRDRGSLLLLWPVITASIFFGSWYGQAHRPDFLRRRSDAQFISMGLLVLGLGIRWMAIFKLGRSFTADVVIRRQQRVEKTGVFSMVRHPSYSGLLIIFTGLGVNTRSWIGLAIVVVRIANALLYRIQVEEAALRDAFGEEYRTYCRSTKRLIPGVF
jgi:protein-S-isoprenylcysteine O-methyltransferase Ste14